MFKLKHLLTFVTVLVFLFGSMSVVLPAQDCPNCKRTKAPDRDSSERMKPQEDQEDQEVIDENWSTGDYNVEETITRKTITSDEPVKTTEEEVVITKRSIRMITVPEYAIKEASRARKAAEVVENASDMWERGIPESLLRRANAIAVFPNVVSGALGFGGRWGKGLMSRRDESGNWIAPSFVNITGGSFGFQIGVEATDLILVFTDSAAVESLLKGKLKIGADAAATAGPFGRKAEIGTDIFFKSAIYSYSNSKGLFLGVALDGATITVDDSSNQHAYSQHIHGEEVLLESDVRMNHVVEPFVTALNEHAGYSQASVPGDVIQDVIEEVEDLIPDF